ncbi:MAG: hypothetical protein PVG30_03810 [Gammaproteobacteria bacterium]|jgi:hypothetical protein
MNKQMKSTGCCEPFNPAPWQDKEIIWQNKKFVKDHVISFLHIPLNMKNKIIKNVALIDKAGAKPEEFILLADEKSLWGSDIYFAVTKDVEGAQMVAISGKFLSKVFEGPYKNAGKWVKEMENYVTEKGHTIKQLYFYYTTCPKCAKAYGKNYVVLLAQIA